ncbi:GNAT family N-acetyltransferase [Rubrobacter tropicus]|uniref:GNAT family N-acetyltransferase n=1 Tax=Rubrobacter tropicus TaxID=2653851 RepID=UPI001409AD13|nr:GNAT family N-acetyltransferase [Rubrobacter tropicus]
MDTVSLAARELGGHKPRSQYERYLSEQGQGVRGVLVAYLDGVFAGYVTLNRRSDYTPFRDGGIPEIQDLNVLPRLRRRGVATRLMERVERVAFGESNVIGIGVGLTPDYGPAQRLYVLHGFVPDGEGLMLNGRPVLRGEEVLLDDAVLYMTKVSRPV